MDWIDLKEFGYVGWIDLDGLEYLGYFDFEGFVSSANSGGFENIVDFFEFVGAQFGGLVGVDLVNQILSGDGRRVGRVENDWRSWGAIDLRARDEFRGDSHVGEREREERILLITWFYEQRSEEKWIEIKRNRQIDKLTNKDKWVGENKFIRNFMRNYMINL